MLFCFGNMELQGKEFIRQQWRMWIETCNHWEATLNLVNSFASNGECGLKQASVLVRTIAWLNSFASNGECGLKLARVAAWVVVWAAIHSPAMANVD